MWRKWKIVKTPLTKRQIEMAESKIKDLNHPLEDIPLGYIFSYIFSRVINFFKNREVQKRFARIWEKKAKQVDEEKTTHEQILSLIAKEIKEKNDAAYQKKF